MSACHIPLVRTLSISLMAGLVCATASLAPVSAATSSSIKVDAQQVFLPEIFGAKADNAFDNTLAIQQAIDKATAAGGGMVKLGNGVYLSGPLELKSGVNLHLTADATLKALHPKTGTAGRDFKAAFIGSPSQPGEAFIRAADAKNVQITGFGTIDGSGDTLFWPEAMKVRQRVRGGDPDYFKQRFPGIPLANGMPRPWLIEFSHIDRGLIGAVHLKNSPMWTVVLRNSQNLRLDGTTLRNPPDSPNTDGIDIVSSSHILLSHLDVASGDDNVAIKSGLPTAPGAASTDIVVRDSFFRQGHGVSIGSETAHGIGHIHLSHLQFEGTENGIRIKSARDRGSDIGAITADHLTMRDVRVPITISNVYNGESSVKGALPAIDPLPISATTPRVHDVTIRDVLATGAQAAGVIEGLPEALAKNVTIEHVRIEAKGTGFNIAYAHVKLDDVVVTVPDGAAVTAGPGAILSGAGARGTTK